MTNKKKKVTSRKAKKVATSDDGVSSVSSSKNQPAPPDPEIQQLQDLSVAVVTAINAVKGATDKTLPMLFSELMEKEKAMSLAFAAAILNGVRFDVALIRDVLDDIEGHRLSVKPTLESNVMPGGNLFNLVIQRFNNRYIKQIPARINELHPLFIQGSHVFSRAVFGRTPSEAATWISPLTFPGFVTFYNFVRTGHAVSNSMAATSEFAPDTRLYQVSVPGVEPADFM